MNIHRHIGTQPRRSLDAAFSNFLTNLSIDGTYTVNTDVLEKAYNAIPYEAADADIIMVAGAYKAGSIAAYDSSGNIVPIGYTRAGSAYGLMNGAAVTYAANVPVLDEFHYRPMVQGYLVEDVLDYVIVSGHPSRTIQDIQNLDVLNNGSLSFINPIRLLERNDVSNVSHVFNVPTRHRAATGLTSLLQLNVFYNVENASRSDINVTRILGGINNHSFDMHTDGRLPTPSAGSQTNLEGRSFQKRSYYGLDFSRGWSMGQTAAYLSDISGWRLGVAGTIYQGTLGKYADIQFFYNNVSYPNDSRSFATVAAQAPLKFAASTTPLGSDVIAPILLSNDAIITIKTSTKLQTVSLNSGQSFDVTDYVTNDKLILFAIKYI